jgi:hypothetical protein
VTRTKPMPEDQRHALAMQVHRVNGGTMVSIRVSQLRELLLFHDRAIYLEERLVAADLVIAERDSRITAARRVLKGSR